MSGKGMIVFDFDNTLTVTDTIKFTIGALLLHEPWRFLSILKIYSEKKRQGVTSEELKHAIIGFLIRGREEAWIASVMNMYIRITCHFRMRTIWSVMLEKKHAGEHVLVATASPYFAVAAFMREYGIPVIGTHYQKKNGVYTGMPLEPLSFQNGKLELIKAYMAERHITHIECAYTDSMSDRPLLDASRCGFLVGKKGLLEKYPECSQ